MSAILAFLRTIYEQKEKIVLGVLVVALSWVAYANFMKNGEEDGDNGNNPSGILNDDLKKTPREPTSFPALQLGNPFPVEVYYDAAKGRSPFLRPGDESEKTDDEMEEVSEWSAIKVKSVFDATKSGSYIAIIEVDRRRRFVKEGEKFDDYEVRRIDGVRKCLTIVRRGKSAQQEEEREFCKEE